MSITDNRNDSHLLAIPLSAKGSEEDRRREIAASLPAEIYADLVREANERGISVSQAYQEECERRRRIEAIAPTEEDLAAAPSPPPAQWYDERW